MQETLLIYHDLIEGIVTAMDARDPYMASHSKRVSDIAELICQRMNLPDPERETIHIAAHLHDIGKIGVPDAILIKSTALTDSEWEMMKNHSETGFQILSKVARFEKVAEIVRHHHERWDGKGYPLGIADEQIPIGSRIVALADSIDAMLSNRNYRNALSFEQCRKEIEKNAGIMYDPDVVTLVLTNWSDIVSLYDHLV